MKQVYSVPEPAEAHIVKGVLESNGIQCEIRGENLAGLRGLLPISGETAPSIWIFEDTKYDEARMIIKEYEQTKLNEPANAVAWVCSFCGEESDSEFTECWKCGTSRMAESGEIAD